MQAYCMKCKAKREMKDPRQVTMKNGKPATQGTCPTCFKYCIRNALGGEPIDDKSVPFG